ncbi:MAG: SDR family oxidoreductase [Promethearchaeota archaeon]
MTIKIWLDRFKLEGHIVVVTGAGLIGSAIIRGVAEAGAKVIISEIDKKKGYELEAEYKQQNLDIIYKYMDITNEESVNSFIAEILKDFKKIDGWVNTAYPRTEDWGKKEGLTDFNSFMKNIEMQLGGYYLTSIKAAELMSKKGGGSIINFGSIYGINAPDFSIYKDTQMTTPIPYVAIKGGINMLTKYIASYYGEHNVRANVIAPGGVFDNQPENFVKKYNEKVPLKRMARPDDLIGLVILLLSAAGSYITGQILPIDGGFTII